MGTNVNISFPGLGIDTFTVDKVAFTVGNITIRWYAIMILIGMMIAIGYAVYRSKQEGFTADDVMDLGIFIIPFGVLGARIYYVIMEIDRYILPTRSFWENFKACFNIRGGGLAIYGGVIAGAITLIIVCRVKKKDWRRAFDMCGPGAMIAQAFGRWGNFFNGEAHGGIVGTDSILYNLRMGLYPNDLGTSEMVYVHPTFFYESAWNLLGFILINAFFYRRKKFHGQIFLIYLTWYGFGRMFIEGLRTDSLYIGSIRVSQLVGCLCFVACTGFIIGRLIAIRKNGQSAAYTPVYSAAAPTPAPAVTEEKVAETIEAPAAKTEENVPVAEPAQNEAPTEETNHGDHH